MKKTAKCSEKNNYIKDLNVIKILNSYSVFKKLLHANKKILKNPKMIIF